MSLLDNDIVVVEHVRNGNDIGRWYALFFDKLLFYSVISNYRTSWLLGLIKKTRTVAGTNLLSGWKKLANVLGFKTRLLVEDF